MRALLVLPFIALIAAGSPVPQPKDAPKTTAEKVVGKWELTKSDDPAPPGTKAFIEMTKDGKMKLIIEEKGAETMTFEGKYKVVGETIDYTLNLGGMEKTEILKIKKLTEDELIVVDPDDKKEEFKRVKAKDKKI